MSDFAYEKGVYHVGANWQFQFDIKDATGAPQNVSAYVLRFVGRQPGPVGTLIVNRATGGSGITVGNGDGINDRVTVLVPVAETENAKPGILVAALWREDVSPNTYPLVTGTVDVTVVAERP